MPLLPSFVVAGFNKDAIAKKCEPICRPMLYQPKKPAVGQGLYVQLNYTQQITSQYKLHKDWARMRGNITEVHPSPSFNHIYNSTTPLQITIPGTGESFQIGPSYFVDKNPAMWGKGHLSKEDFILESFGAFHGQTIAVDLELSCDDAGEIPFLDGKWQCVFVLDDDKQCVWVLASMKQI